MIRNFCFTAYDENIPTVGQFGVSYVIVGKEVCPTTNRPHLQGYAECDSPVRFATLKNRYPTMHIENRRGTQEEAINYCKKDGDYTETGVKKAQGKRKDLDEVVEAVAAGVPTAEIAAAHPVQFIKYHRGIEALCNNRIADRDVDDPPFICWRWGSTGVGKTKLAYTVHRGLGEVYIKDNTKWWNGYCGQPCIILDDFDPKSWPFRDLLRLLDRYPYSSETKGGYVRINSHYIYITTEHPPEMHWAGNDLAQIMRRLTCVTHVTEVGGNTSPPLLFDSPNFSFIKNDF